MPQGKKMERNGGEIQAIWKQKDTSKRLHLALWCFIMRSHKLGFVGAPPDTQPVTDWQTEKGIRGLSVDGPSCQYYVHSSFRLIRETIHKKKKKMMKCFSVGGFLSEKMLQDKVGLHGCSKWENCITDGNISHMDEQKLAAVNECGSTYSYFDTNPVRCVHQIPKNCHVCPFESAAMKRVVKQHSKKSSRACVWLVNYKYVHIKWINHVYLH